MESTECYVGHERTGFTFCQICAKPSIGGNNIEGVRECKLFNGSILDAMNRKHVVLDVPSDILFDFGYVYIHEAKPRLGPIIIGVSLKKVVTYSKTKW